MRASLSSIQRSSSIVSFCSQHLLKAAVYRLYLERLWKPLSKQIWVLKTMIKVCLLQKNAILFLHEACRSWMTKSYIMIWGSWQQVSRVSVIKIQSKSCYLRAILSQGRFKLIVSWMTFTTWLAYCHLPLVQILTPLTRVWFILVSMQNNSGACAW